MLSSRSAHFFCDFTVNVNQTHFAIYRCNSFIMQTYAVCIWCVKMMLWFWHFDCAASWIIHNLIQRWMDGNFGFRSSSTRNNWNETAPQTSIECTQIDIWKWSQAVISDSIRFCIRSFLSAFRLANNFPSYQVTQIFYRCFCARTILLLYSISIRTQLNYFTFLFRFNRFRCTGYNAWDWYKKKNVDLLCMCENRVTKFIIRSFSYYSFRCKPEALNHTRFTAVICVYVHMLWIAYRKFAYNLCINPK